MYKKQKDSVKVADLIIFCNEKDSQQYLVFDLKYGDNIIGKNSSLCSIVLSFTNDVDDVHTKITIEDDDYTIEDLGSKKGTFKIKNDNSLIRLKPNKSYDLSNNHSFYIGKYKCKFQIVKPGRAMAFCLSPTDILNSQKNNNVNTPTNQNTVTNKKGSKKIQSYEDDIEDFTDLPSKQQQKKNQIASKIIQNRLEVENIDEEEDEKHFQKAGNNKAAQASSTAKKTLNTQKNFVKSKGQLAKGMKGSFKNGQKDEDNEQKKEDIYDIKDTQLYKVSDEEEDTEFQFSFPKSFKKSNNNEEEQVTRKRSAVNRKNNGGIQTQQEQKDEEIKLDSQFLKRIQDKLKMNQINEQRKIIDDLAQKYSSQKNTQKQSQDIPFDDKKEKLSQLEKKESEDFWSPSSLKRKNNSKAENASEKTTKTKTNSKNDKIETESSKVEVPSKKNSKEKEQANKQEKVNQKNSKKQEEHEDEEKQETKMKEGTAKTKKEQKIQQKSDDKIEKLKQQAENVLNTIKNSNKSKKQNVQKEEKQQNKSKDSTKNKTKSKTFDDSTSISNDDQEGEEDEEYSIEEEDLQSQSQKVSAKNISTRKRRYDDLMTQQPNQETSKVQKNKDQKEKQATKNGKEKIKAVSAKEETASKFKESEVKKNQQKETIKPVNSKETKKVVEEKEKQKTQKDKAQQKQSKGKNIEKIEEEQPASVRRSARKAQIEEEIEEKQEKVTKKSVSKSTQKASTTKSSSKKQSKKDIVKEDEEEVEDKMEIEEKKSTRKSARKSILKPQSNENSQLNEEINFKDKTKKSEKTDKASNDSKSKSKSKKESKKPKSLIRRTLGSKKEALLLQQSAGISVDIPRRNKFRIIFSNSSVSDEEKKEMSTYGVKILNDFHSANDFNFLVTDEFKRRLKTLVALNKGYPIISQNWIKECIKEDKIVPYESFIITKVDKALAKLHDFNLKKSYQNQKDHPEGILQGLSFVCQNSFDNLHKDEVKKLIESAGGSFFYEKPKNTSAYLLSDPSKVDYNNQQNENNEIVLDIEGVLQTCLLQYNVLDNYIITQQVKEKKSTKKK